MINTLTKEDYKRTLAEGISYKEYKDQMAKDGASNPDAGTREYIKLNQARMSRIDKTIKPSAGLLHQVQQLTHKTYWLILSEHWCGDSAQNLPVLNALAEANPEKLELRLIYREQQPALMNAHLTNGTRSIPKLIQLDEHFNVTGSWGPRPNVAQKLVADLKSNPETAPAYKDQLHLWYVKNKHQALQEEIAHLLTKANMLSPQILS